MNRKPNSISVSQVEGDESYLRGIKHESIAIQQSIGTIAEVHEKVPSIKVTMPDGSLFASGHWVNVAMSKLDIMQRYGRLRIGMKVLLTYSIDRPATSFATVIGVENEKLGLDENEDNSVATGLYEIFTPGGI
jgi:hypothetical protein